MPEYTASSIGNKSAPMPVPSSVSSSSSVHAHCLNAKSTCTTTFQVAVEYIETFSWSNKESQWHETHQELRGILKEELTICDVLCGGGNRTNRHSGNLFYRSLLYYFCHLYTKSKKGDKKVLVEAIVDAIRTIQHGRFMKQHNTTGVWFEVGDKYARSKTSQSLRDTKREILAATSDTSNKICNGDTASPVLSRKGENYGGSSKETASNVMVLNSCPNGDAGRKETLEEPKKGKLITNDDITESDVLLGDNSDNHVGNKVFESFVSRFFATQNSVSCLMKGKISQLVVTTVRESNGRFLKQLHPDAALWSEIGDHNAKKKVLQTLREQQRVNEMSPLPSPLVNPSLPLVIPAKRKHFSSIPTYLNGCAIEDETKIYYENSKPDPVFSSTPRKGNDLQNSSKRRK